MFKDLFFQYKKITQRRAKKLIALLRFLPNIFSNSSTFSVDLDEEQKKKNSKKTSESIYIYT